MAGFATATALRGHEFHYSTIIDQPDEPLAEVIDADNQKVPETGSVRGHATGTSSTIYRRLHHDGICKFCRIWSG